MITWSATLSVSDRVNSLLRNPELFEGWLEGRESTAVVGYARSGESCPLARFIWESTGEKLFVADRGVYYDYDAKVADVVVADLPRWAQRFVALLYDAAPDTPTSPVTADEARRVLGVALRRDQQ